MGNMVSLSLCVNQCLSAFSPETLDCLFVVLAFLVSPNQDLYNPGITYRYFKQPVALPFGFGLSYTTFAYSALKVNTSTIRPCDVVQVTVSVTNTGGLVYGGLMYFYHYFV